MRRGLVLVLAALVCGGLAGCGGDDSSDPMTIPPSAPSGHVAGATLPRQAGGYSVLGNLPASGQLTATYALDTDLAVVAVVTLWQDDAQGATPLTDDQWYGPARCGILDQIDEVQQAACIVPLVDGVMTVVGSATQTPEDLAGLAQAIRDTLP
jgi:hypothetical protein